MRHPSRIPNNLRHDNARYQEDSHKDPRWVKKSKDTQLKAWARHGLTGPGPEPRCWAALRPRGRRKRKRRKRRRRKRRSRKRRSRRRKKRKRRRRRIYTKYLHYYLLRGPKMSEKYRGQRKTKIRIMKIWRLIQCGDAIDNHYCKLLFKLY